MTGCCLVLGARREQGPLVFNYSASSLSLIIAEVMSAFNVMAKIDQWSSHVLVRHAVSSPLAYVPLSLFLSCLVIGTFCLSEIEL